MKTQSTHSIAAKELKKELTKAFPNVKFSVKSDYNSINIDWNFGPTIAQVEKYSQRRQYGNFDGMTDSYNYTGAGLVADETGNVKEVAAVKYVFENRNSKYEAGYKLRADVKAIYAQIAEDWNYKPTYDNDYAPNGVWEGADNTSSNRYYRIAQECSFVSDNVELLKMEYNEYVTGFHPYTIWYKDLNTGKIHSGKRFKSGKY